MNTAAIWHEATQRFCFCTEPGRFRFRLQTGKDDLRAVRLHTRDKYLPLKYQDTRRTTPMKKVASDALRDYYEAELEFRVVCLRYCFELEDRAGRRLFYFNGGFTEEKPEDVERLFDCPQSLREQERFQVPKWAENRVVYQVFPDRFASSRPVEDRVWYQAPADAGASLGGDLRGILSRLDYLRDLGADILYMTPIFRARSVHKYDTIDYYSIDPAFGTEEDLLALVDRAHALGLRVILDGVFNHTSPEFFAFADLLANQERSPYRQWYYVQDFPVRHSLWKPNYQCFGYYGHMPKVNLSCPEAAQYFIDVALYWLRRAGVDGWRLDVGDEISHVFWRQFRQAVKAEFPQALIVGEIWHHAPDFLQGDQWDSVMNYPFYRAAADFAAGTGSPSALLGELGFQRGNTHTSAYPLLWNLIGSHDTPRIRSLCGADRDRHHLAAAVQLLSPGMPMLYYGDEVGMTGDRDPDCRRGMLWDERRQDKITLERYRALLRVRREVAAITRGELLQAQARDEDGLLLLARGLDGQQVTLLFHNRPGEASVPELAGRTDALTGKVFDGTLTGIGAAVLIP